MNTHQSRNRRSGFTLIALLFVIAIIALLTAILFPIFAKARAISCLSNEKRFGPTEMRRTQNNEEAFPAVSSCGQSISPLFPYLQSTNVFKRPADPAATPRMVTYSANIVMQRATTAM